MNWEENNKILSNSLFSPAFLSYNQVYWHVHFQHNDVE